MHFLRCSLVLAGTLGGLAGAQVPPAAPADESQAAAKPWRWADSRHQPFQDWHTDVAVQARLYDEASAAMRAAVGVDLPGKVEVVLAPRDTFSYVTMEVGAKDGSLELDLSVSRAIELLSLGSHSQAADGGAAGLDHAESVLAHGSGCYSPKHVKRMIFLDPHCAEAQAGETLRHELVHAMQDEAFGFASFFNFDGISPDEKWARQALEEGYVVCVADPAGADADAAPSTLAPADDWSARFLRFLYRDGERLIARVRRADESRHDLLLRLFTNPPRTTREVLHPELYEARLEHPAELDLPEPASFGALRAVVLGALTEAELPSAWSSRLGEFGLQSLLAGLGAGAEEAGPLAAAWRNDILVNAPEWRQPAVVACVWCLEDSQASERLEAALARLVEAQGRMLSAESVRMRAGGVAIQSSVSDGPRPQVILARLGESVALLVGRDMESLLERVRAQP